MKIRPSARLIGCLQIFAAIQIAGSQIIQRSEVEDQIALETKTNNHGYRAYYVKSSSSNNNANSPQTYTRRYGVWYPKGHSRPYKPSSYYSPSSYPSRRPSYPSSSSSNTFSQYQPSSYSHRQANGRYRIPDKLLQVGAYKLAQMVDRANLNGVLSGERQFTVFAPTDKALEEFLNSQSEEVCESFMENPEALSSFLLNHVVPGALRSSDLMGGSRVVSVGGASLGVAESKEGGLLVGGARLMREEGRTDLEADNGFVHFVDDVIFPYESFGKDNDEDKPKKKRLLVGLDDDDPELLVTIDGGRIRGINLGENHRAWLGIPYAKPPIDDLRFAPPEKVENWEDDGILETRKQPNACQLNPDTFFGDFEGATQWNPNTDISEDCLYLNVHAPRNKTGKLPVLVWIYGGGYMSGSATLDLYDPSSYIDSGGLIYVALQYRVGSHGFLYLGEDSGAPGNAGLLDQVMALEWIQDNIEAFGGDPDNVALMGESAGASSIALHMVSPMSCKLFHKVILQSSGLTPRWGWTTRQVAKERAEKLAEDVGCPSSPRREEDTVECLRRKDSSELLAVEYNVDEYSLNFFPFGPVTDGKFLLSTPERLLEKRAFHAEKPVLLGTNTNEGFWSLLYLLPDIFPNKDLRDDERSLTADEYMKAVTNMYSGIYPPPGPSLIAREYRNKFDGEDKYFRALDQMAADSDFVCDVEKLAQALAGSGSNVYRYYFNHMSSRNEWPDWAGVKHGDEIEFTFGLPLANPKDYEAKEVALATDVVTYWTNFVKTGSPNPDYLRSWPTYKAPFWQYLNLTADATSIGEDEFSDQCEFWWNILPNVLSYNDREDEEQLDEEEDAEDVDFSFCQ